MRMKIKEGIDSNVLREDRVGSASSKICYPGVSSCISITCVSNGSLMGVHVTIATSAEELKCALDYFSLKGGGAVNIYVVGAIREFKDKTFNKNVNTRKKLSKLLKSSVNKNATVQFYDTSGRDLNIMAERQNGAQCNFSHIDANCPRVSGDTYPVFTDTTGQPLQLNAGHFVTR